MESAAPERDLFIDEGAEVGRGEMTEVENLHGASVAEVEGRAECHGGLGVTRAGYRSAVRERGDLEDLDVLGAGRRRGTEGCVRRAGGEARGASRRG